MLACGSEHDDPQRLLATGLLSLDDGSSADGVVIDRYALTFIVAGQTGDVPVQRSFTGDGFGDPIITDASGRFQIDDDNLALTYDWEQDELVCGDVCLSYATVCYDVTEDVCTDTCFETQCWDDCTTECWDETYCDDDGNCWTETVCEDVCGTVCEDVSYPCNCYVEVYEQCDDECVESAEECAWVTRNYTSPAGLEQIVETRADLWLKDSVGAEHLISGTLIEAFQQQRCEGDQCSLVNMWVQKDLFPVDVELP